MQTLEIQELLKRAVRSEIARVHTQVPARVISYSAADATAEVQLVVSHSYLDADTGERVYYKPPPIFVRVIFPAILTWPLEKDDVGWVQFAERSLDEHLATGRDTEPKDARRFDLSDGVFYPTYLRGEFDLDADATILSGGDVRVRSTPTSTTRPVAISPEIESYLIGLIQELLPHVHSDPLTGTTGPSPGPFTPPTPAQFDSANLESE